MRAGIFNAPGLMLYAARHLANRAFRCSSLEARGLLLTLYLETWENGRAPADPALLARVIGESLDDVARLLPELSEFIEVEGGFLTCPEVERYRIEQAERRRKQSEGGRMTGAKNADRAKRGRSAMVGADHDAKRQAGHDASEVLPRGEETSEEEGWKGEKSFAVGGDVDDWNAAYEKEEARLGQQH